MYEYAVETRHVEQPRHPSRAELSVIRFERELRTYHIEGDTICAPWYGGAALYLDTSDGVERHVLGESTVSVFYGVADIITVGIVEVADGIGSIGRTV